MSRPITYDKFFKFKTNDEFDDMLNYVAEHTATKKAEVIRNGILIQYNKLRIKESSK